MHPVRLAYAPCPHYWPHSLVLPPAFFPSCFLFCFFISFHRTSECVIQLELQSESRDFWTELSRRHASGNIAILSHGRSEAGARKSQTMPPHRHSALFDLLEDWNTLSESINSKLRRWLHTGRTATMSFVSSITRGSTDLAPRTETTFQNKSTLSADDCAPLSWRQTRAAGVHLKARMSSDADVAGCCSVEEAFQSPSSGINGCSIRKRHLLEHPLFNRHTIRCSGNLQDRFCRITPLFRVA